MCNIHRLAVFAIISSEELISVRTEQRCLTSLTGNSIALGFPVHITLKGRFLADGRIAKELFKNTHSADLSSLNIPTTVCISNPQYINPDLSWLEISHDSEGFNSLLFLHQLFEQKFKNILLKDETPEAYKFSGFRPHITLGWGVTPQIWNEYITCSKFSLKKATISHIALAIYPQDWPMRESVHLMLKLAI